jgi:hypothetical protein
MGETHYWYENFSLEYFSPLEPQHYMTHKSKCIEFLKVTAHSTKQQHMIQNY